MLKQINWKVFITLLILSVVWVLSGLPYIFTLQSASFSKLPVSLELFLLVQIIQTIVIFSILIFLWLYFGKKVWLWATLIEKTIEKKANKNEWIDMIWKSLVIWWVVWVLIWIADQIFMTAWVNLKWSVQIPPIRQWLLASFYWAIAEEIVLRLFLMSFLVWWLALFYKSKDWKTSKLDMWLAIIASAILFGLGHLPIAASLAELTPLFITRTLVLNWIWGIAFGWLYWKKWLESAMIAHFWTDIILHWVLLLV